MYNKISFDIKNEANDILYMFKKIFIEQKL